jgi:Dolichyl-phosphate-mannose-protein mannosyltransferase
VAQAPAIAKPDECEPGPEAISWARDILRRRPDAAGCLLIVAVGLLMAWHTWAHWGSIHVDCGLDLYVAAEILRGKLLYRDIWYQYGPLGPYLAAGLIGLFGRHLDVFYGFGIALALACALLLYRIGTVLEGRGVGLAGALILLLCGFGPQISNYAFPYVYPTPLGLFLSLVCAWLTMGFLLEGEWKRLILAGVAAALALLCKQEMGAAAYVMLAFGIVGVAAAERSWRVLWNCIVACIPGGLLWAGIYGWFFWKVGLKVVLFENWINTPGTYYSRHFGPQINGLVGLRLVPDQLIMLLAGGIVVLFVWFWIARSARLRPARRGNSMLAGWMAMLVAAAVLVRYLALDQLHFPAILLWLFVFPPGIYLIGCGFLAYTLFEGRRKKARFSRPSLALATFTVFALTLAVRVLTTVGPYAYGVFYAPPLLLVFLVVLAKILAAAMRDIEHQRRRKLINFSLGVEILLVAILLVPGTGKRTVPFSTSWGTIYLTPTDATVARQVLDFTVAQKRRGRTVAFLPEWPMMYALTETEAPSRWYMAEPGCIPPDKEDTYISDLKSARPTFIVITNRNNWLYGVPYFGIDYDRKIYRWIERHYRVTGQFGDFQRVRGAPLAGLIYERGARLPSAAKGNSGPA